MANRNQKGKILKEKRIEAKEEKKRLAAIEKSRQERKNLREKYGNGGLPSNYATTEAKTFDDAKKYQEKKTAEKKKNSNTSDYTTRLKGETLKKTYRDRGGVLRYPYEALTETTDYLQIDINQYEPSKDRSGNENNLVGRVGTRRLSTRGRNPAGLTTKSLVNKGTILLQIPAELQDGNSVSYGDNKMNTIVGAALGGTQNIIGGAADALTAEGGGNIADRGVNAFKSSKQAVLSAVEASSVSVDAAKGLFNAKIATGVVGAFGGNVTVNQLLARQSGQIFNPNMELLFNGPTLRNFRFSFKMTPRSPEEAEQCKLIIRSFKMNMAPKVTSGRGTQSLFLNTPNVFELRYKSGFANHPFLHRFKQCFLTDISVNYTGEGVYATYENREPVSMIMDLTFKELEPIYDQDYFDDGGFDADSTVGY